METEIVRKWIKLLKESIENLYEKEKFIVESNVNERCMAAHIFSSIKREWDELGKLGGYDVDYEYNREGVNGVPKSLFCKYENDKEKKYHFIIPDLILHKRGCKTEDGNLCVIEFKKFGIDPKDDIYKLEEMTRQDNDGKFKYVFGLHIVFGEKISQTEFELFVNGESIDKRSIDDIEKSVMKFL